MMSTWAGHKRHRITHFLRIPFATANSTPQLVNSINRIAADPVARDIPREAWLQPDEIHFSLGGLKLTTPGHVKAAMKQLEALELDAIMSMEPTLSPPTSRIIDNVQEALRNAKPHLAQPPAIMLHGLVNPPRELDYPAATRTLSCKIVESRPWLHHITAMVSTLSIQSGLQPLNKELPPLTARLLSCRYLKTDIFKDLPGGKAFFRMPRLNASNFRPKYDTYPWTTEFALERVCLSESGLKDVFRNGKLIKTGFRNVASIPFPGMASQMAIDEHPEDVYVKAAKCNVKYKPFSPRIISTLASPRCSIRP